MKHLGDIYGTLVFKRCIDGFFRSVFGTIIGFCGTIFSSTIKLEELKEQHSYELENRVVEKRNEICSDMLESIYSLKKMDDGLISVNLLSFKEESYTIFAQAQIYCSNDVVNYYDQFLNDFFGKQIYNGGLVESKLVPAIRRNIGVNEE